MSEYNTIEEYIEAVSTKLTEKFASNGKEVEPVYREIFKSNTTYHGLCIKVKNDEQSSVSPVFYMDYPFHHQDEGSIEDYVNEIYETYNELSERGQELGNVDWNTIATKEHIKENVVPALIDTKRNIKFLQDKVHVPFGDLAVVFKVPVSHTEKDYGFITLSNDFFNNIDMSMAELLEYSGKNMDEKLNVHVQDMADFLKVIREDLSEEIQEAVDDAPEDYGLYIVKPNENNFCKTPLVLTSKKYLTKLAKDIDVGGFIIIPSSIYELLLTPLPSKSRKEYAAFAEFCHNDKEAVEYISNMVKQINEQELAVEEILTDRPFIFNADDGKLYNADGDVIPFIY